MIIDEVRHHASLIPKQSVLVLHVGLSGLYENSKGYEHDALSILDEIRKQLEPREIYVPTFTYTFTKSKAFDVLNTPSEVGRFSEEIRSNPELGIKRNMDPVFSVVETEKDLLKDKRLITNAFGEKSIWHYLDNEPHYILNINLPTSITSTQLHHFEYINNVPYRFLKTFEGEVCDWINEKRHVNYDYFVRDLSKETEWNRNKIADLAKSNGGMIKTNSMRSFDWQILKKALINEISSNAYYLVE